MVVAKMDVAKVDLSEPAPDLQGPVAPLRVLTRLDGSIDVSRVGRVARRAFTRYFPRGPDRPTGIVGLSIHNKGSTSKLNLSSTTAATWNLEQVVLAWNVNLAAAFDRRLPFFQDVTAHLSPARAGRVIGPR
jgi:hypothetical protein